VSSDNHTDFYNKGFQDELEKLGFFKFKKRRRSKKPTWRVKFARKLKSQVEEHNFGAPMARGFARFLLRR